MKTIAYAEKNGFVPFDREASYKAGDKVYYNNRDKSLILAVIGKEGCKNGVRMAAAHIDSPRLDLKPYPMYEANDLVLFKSHYYGGIKKYQWDHHSAGHARTCCTSRRNVCRHSFG